MNYMHSNIPPLCVKQSIEAYHSHHFGCALRLPYISALRQDLDAGRSQGLLQGSGGGGCDPWFVAVLQRVAVAGVGLLGHWPSKKKGIELGTSEMSGI